MNHNRKTLNSAVTASTVSVSGYHHMSNSDGHRHDDCSIMMSVKDECIDIKYSDDVSTTKMEIKQEHRRIHTGEKNIFLFSM